VRNKHVSSWAEEFDYEELNEDLSNTSVPLTLLEEAREALTRTTKQRAKKNKIIKTRKECWQ